MPGNPSQQYEVAIIGGGCAGLSAAMYSGRFQLKTLVVAELMGGTITMTDVVENYPGFVRLTGQELADKLAEHARDYPSVDFEDGKVTKITKCGEHAPTCWVVETSEKKFHSKTIIFATGTEWKKLGVPGEKEYSNRGVHWCALCLPPEESIVANSSLVKIGETTPLTRVLTSDGSFQRVSGFARRPHKGKLVWIKTKYFTEPTALTPEHPVWRVKASHGIGAEYWKYFGISEPEWVEAGLLQKGDCVVYPIIKEVADVNSIEIASILDIQTDGAGIAIPHHKTHTAIETNNVIEITPEFLRLVGYYLSDGSASKHTLRFYFNRKERDFAEDVQKLISKSFALESRIDLIQNGGVLAVTAYSKVVADFFKALFGKYSYDKSIPNWMLLLPPEKQGELVKGVWRGDGTTREKDFTLVSSSRKLVYQMRDILLRLGVIPSIHQRGVRSLNKKPQKIQGRDISFKHDKYHVVAGGQFLQKMSDLLEIPHPFLKKRTSSAQHAWIKDGLAIIPVREIKQVDYDGEVLSLAVENNNSFVAKNFIVHNCDGFAFKEKTVAVVGGSDSAAKDALLMTQWAKKVYVIYRGEKIRPEPVNMKRVEENEKIEVINKANVLEIKGDGKKVNQVILDREVNGSKEFSLDGVFVAIGHNVLSQLAQELGVNVNRKGEITIDRLARTNMPGIFAAGDVVDTEFKQAITGAAEGVLASYSAYQHVKNEGVLTSSDSH